jgi:hypothetical protein
MSATDRLDIPNGYQARVSPDGQYLTSSNVECLLTTLVRNGENVVAAGTRRLSYLGGGQSYGGWWLTRFVLRYVQDRAVDDRLQFLYDTRTLLTQQAPNAPYVNDTMARDNHVADSVPGIWYDGQFWPDSVNRPPEDVWGPLRVCEGWTANTEKNNRSLVVRTASGAVSGRLDFPVFITNYILGPDGWVIFYKEGDPRLYAWNAVTNRTIDATIQPIGPNSPWGEGLGWCFRRTNGEIWLATWTIVQPSGKCYVLVRPLLGLPPDFCFWREFGGINYISAAEDPDGFLIVAGAFNADAYATAFAPGTSMTKFTPDYGTGGGGGNGDEDDMTPEEKALLFQKLNDIEAEAIAAKLEAKAAKEAARDARAEAEQAKINAATAAALANNAPITGTARVLGFSTTLTATLNPPPKKEQ